MASHRLLCTDDFSGARGDTQFALTSQLPLLLLERLDIPRQVIQAVCTSASRPWLRELNTGPQTGISLELCARMDSPPRITKCAVCHGPSAEGKIGPRLRRALSPPRGSSLHR